MTDAVRVSLHETVLLDESGGLLRQLDPAPGNGGKLRCCLCDIGAETQESLDPPQVKALGHGPDTFVAQELLDSLRLADDRKAIAIADELNLVVHRHFLGLLGSGQR